MPHNNKYLQPRGITRASAVYLLLAVSGLSFCFFLGFPFDNHNESYIWLVRLSQNNLVTTATRQIVGGIETFRPLGMANAWLGYRLTGNIYLQQILNWLFAVSSFILLFAAAGNKILFSFFSFIICTCFFSGYIYLFHLHGVFYGPFQLYVSGLVYIATRQRKLSSSLLVLISLITLVVSLYHTFALLVFCAFLAGYLLQLSKKEKASEYIKLIFAIVLTLAFAKLILVSKEMKSLQALTNGLLASFRLAEVSKNFGWIATALTLFTIVPLIKNITNRFIAGCGIILISILLIYAGIPVLMLWVAACILKTITEKNMVMTALIAATAILPLGSSSGSPTYVVFVLMICAFATAENKILYIADSIVLKRISVTVIVLLAICLFAIKKGYRVPGASSAITPLLAEQEKTRQLKNIIAWKLANKEYATFGIALYDSTELPVNSKNAVIRTERPVARQGDLDGYLDYFSGEKHGSNAGKPQQLYITFGNKILQNKQLIFSVQGPWNGQACVFK